uniref:Immunoglobulin V-set domain-containing protein n=1 Tax=Pogona vitticeps TaxID=103695 RepID=A0ABM5ES19_9SAUR
MGRNPEDQRLSHPGFPLARKTSWLGALLAAAILSSCCPLSHAQSMWKVKVEPAKPNQGQSVTLTPENAQFPGHTDVSQCSWYRERLDANSVIISQQRNVFAKGASDFQQSKGPAYTGREELIPSCSLSITYLQLKDSGVYKVVIDDNVAEAGTAQLEVIDPTKTTTTSSTTIATTFIVTTKNPVTVKTESVPLSSFIWIITCLVVIVALLLTVAYFVFHVHRLKNMMTSAQTASYENFPPSKQGKPESSNEANNIYQSLQIGHHGEYDQLSWKQSNPQATGLRY